jgi:hypothetical protein
MTTKTMSQMLNDWKSNNPVTSAVCDRCGLDGHLRQACMTREPLWKRGLRVAGRLPPERKQ